MKFFAISKRSASFSGRAILAMGLQGSDSFSGVRCNATTKPPSTNVVSNTLLSPSGCTSEISSLVTTLEENHDNDC